MSILEETKKKLIKLLSKSSPETRKQIISELESELKQEEDNMLIADFIKNSNISSVLKQALDEIGFSNKYPKNDTKVFTESLQELFENLDETEKQTFVNFVSTDGYGTFIKHWQTFQSNITNHIK